jgi:glycine cleavage system H protein
MTVLLVLFMLIGLLFADFLIQRRKQKQSSIAAIQATQLASPSQWHLSDDIVLAPNHLWMRREHDNSITVGIDNFLLGLTGSVEGISLPSEGQLVGRGEPSIQLTEKNKTLRFDSPIEGQVLRRNEQLVKTPTLAHSNPYTSGWLFKILPSSNAKPLSLFMKGESAIEWLKTQNELVKEFLVASTPRLEFATMQDGGAPVDGVLKGFNQNVWSEFENRFLPRHASASNEGEYDNA